MDRSEDDMINFLLISAYSVLSLIVRHMNRENVYDFLAQLKSYNSKMPVIPSY